MSGDVERSGPVVVSACLLGTDCTWRGGNEERPTLVELLEGHPVVPICPEVAGGLTVPRERAEIAGGRGDEVLDGRARVVTADGVDVTAAYLRGAAAAVGLAREVGATTAVLKSRSPSCGPRGVYDGSHSRRVVAGGIGVTAAALVREGLTVLDEDAAETSLQRGDVNRVGDAARSEGPSDRHDDLGAGTQEP